MLPRILPVFLFIISISCSSQKISRTEITPPGTVTINDTLFVDQTEVANIHWREYLHYLVSINKDTLAYMKALPDTLTWYNLEWVSDSLVNVFAQYYFRHPAYNNYPIVGISYEQAIEFCKWRTMVANQFSYFKEKGITNWKSYTDDKFPLRYIYRLPTKKEWETIATAGVDSTKKTLKRFSKKYSFSYNSKELFYSSRKFEHGRMFIPDPPTTNVRSFYLSKLGTYNMTGNVAEMVLEKGIAKGGSFIHPLASCKNDVDQYYPEPIYWLGFRCVAVVVK